MKTYQLDSEPRKLYFTNYNRMDEEILFQQIFSTLQSNPEIEIGKKQTGPSEDLYHCKVSGDLFLLVYDIDYGTYIQADDVKTVQKMKSILE